MSDYKTKTWELPPEVMLVTRDADYVIFPTLRHEPITGATWISDVKFTQVPREVPIYKDRDEA